MGNFLFTYFGELLRWANPRNNRGNRHFGAGNTIGTNVDTGGIYYAIYKNCRFFFGQGQSADGTQNGPVPRNLLKNFSTFLLLTWLATLGPQAPGTCEPPPQISFGAVECSTDTYIVGTSCKVTCTQNRVPFSDNTYQPTNKSIKCMENGEWSENFPTCKCATCRTGENCQLTTSWNEVRGSIRHNQRHSYLNYAGNTITTSAESKWRHGKLRYKCLCQDEQINGHSVSCTGESRYGSCEHACSLLIQAMVNQNHYEPPCDPGAMRTRC